MNRRLHFCRYLWFTMFVFLMGTMHLRAQDSAIQGSGTVIYEVTYGGTKTCTVNASYSDGQLVISGLNLDYGSYDPITFVVDLATGTATATNQVAQGAYGYYYGNMDDYQKVINATIKNTGASSCVLDMGNWGVGEEYGGELEIYDDYYNTTITFDFAIPGLISETGGGEDPGQGGDADVQGSGTMTYEVTYGGTKTCNVEANYSNGQLVISNLNLDYGSYDPITFVVDLATGTATATNQVAQGAYGYYYGNMDDYQKVINATIKNTGASSCVLDMGDWGVGEEYGGELDIYDDYYNTFITFNFAIPGLIGETGGGGDDPDDPWEDNPVDDAPGNYVYRITCDFTPTGSSWSTDITGGSVVEFTEDKLYIGNICTGITLEGDILPGENRAVFQNKVSLSDGDTFIAYYNSGNQQIEPDQFYFDFTDNHDTITLSDIEGNSVIIGPKYRSGYWGVRWRNVTLTLYPEPVPTPPADYDTYNMKEEFVDGWNEEQSQTIQVYQKENTVWFKDMIYRGAYMKGQIMNNGNIRFKTPQFQGVSTNYLRNTYARKNGSAVDHFDLILQEDGSYILESDVQIWKGDILEVENLYMKNAVFNMLSSYDGAPMPPTNVQWDGSNDHIVNFNLSLTGENGEELNQDWTYWQVLVDGEPYQFTNAVYGGWNFLDESPYYINATAQYMYNLPGTYENVLWGKIGNGKYSVYLPQFTSSDNIEIRCGYQAPGSEMMWSEAVVPAEGEIVVNQLPDEALYSTSVTYDSDNGGWMDEGLAYYARFTEEGAQISGFFGKNGWINGQYADARKQKVSFTTPQTIGVANGKTIELWVAKLASGTPSSQMQFQPLDEFTMLVSNGAGNIRLEDESLYLLEVTDGVITNVMYGDIYMSMVEDKAPVIPDDAVRSNYLMSSVDVFGKSILSPVQMYRKDNNIWIDGMVRYDDETAVVEGKMVGDNLVFSFPQFLGVMRGKIAYASSDAWSFYPGDVTFTPIEDGKYHSDGEIWIGPGLGWPEWRAAMDVTLTPDDGNPKVIVDSRDIETVTATTASINVRYTFLNVPEDAKCFIEVKESTSGTIQSFEIPTPKDLASSTVVTLTDLLPATVYDFVLNAMIKSETGSEIAVSEDLKGSFMTESRSGYDNQGEGNMVYQFDMNPGMNNPILNPPASHMVNGKYEDGILTISDMPFNYAPIQFIINRETGAALAEDQIALESRQSYYVAAESKMPMIHATIENFEGENGKWSVMTIEPWGEADIVGERVLLHSTLYNTRIVFDFAIPDLINEDTNSIDSVVGESIEVRYFTIEGIEVTNPVAGQIYIKVEKTSDGKIKTGKILYRDMK